MMAPEVDMGEGKVIHRVGETPDGSAVHEARHGSVTVRTLDRSTYERALAAAAPAMADAMRSAAETGREDALRLAAARP